MTEPKKPSVKSKVEAVLFSTGQKINLDDLSKLCRSKKEEVISALTELKMQYDEKQSSLMLVEEGDFWKFSIRDQFVPIVKKIVTETELSKSILETLAVIAFKYPILQSDLIKIRTNKAYDHLNELEAAGYISRQKHGRTNLIKLTDKFFKYFDLTEEKLKDRLKDFDSLAAAIKEKENDINKIKEEQQKRAEELKQQDEKIKKEIESLDKVEEEYEIPLETYETNPQEVVVQKSIENKPPQPHLENIDDLEIVDVEPQNQQNVIEQNTGENIPSAEDDKHHSDNKKKTRPKRQKKIKGGIKLTPELEAKVELKVEEIIHGGKNGNKEER